MKISKRNIRKSVLGGINAEDVWDLIKDLEVYIGQLNAHYQNKEKSLNKKYESLQKKLEGLEGKIAATQSDPAQAGCNSVREAACIDGLMEQIETLNNKFDKLLDEINGQLSSLAEDVQPPAQKPERGNASTYEPLNESLHASNNQGGKFGKTNKYKVNINKKSTGRFEYYDPSDSLDGYGEDTVFF